MESFYTCINSIFIGFIGFGGLVFYVYNKNNMNKKDIKCLSVEKELKYKCNSCHKCYSCHKVCLLKNLSYECDCFNKKNKTKGRAICDDCVIVKKENLIKKPNKTHILSHVTEYSDAFNIYADEVRKLLLLDEDCECPTFVGTIYKTI
jgi:hypothetical protein